MLKYIYKACDVLARTLEIIMIVFISIMSVSMLVQIVARYVFDSGFVWTEELSRFLVIWMVFIGTAVGIYRNEHIKVTVLDELFKGKANMVLGVIQLIIVTVYFVLIIKFGLSSIKVISGQTSPNMGISMAVVYSIIPVSYMFALIFSVVNIVRIFHDRIIIQRS